MSVGQHRIQYVASDKDGNKGYCHFSITIRGIIASHNKTNRNALIVIFLSVETLEPEQFDRRATKYRAVLICPRGMQYLSNTPDKYDVSSIRNRIFTKTYTNLLQNDLLEQQGCYWRHVRTRVPINEHAYRYSSFVSNNENNSLQELRLRHRPFSLYNRCC